MNHDLGIFFYGALMAFNEKKFLSWNYFAKRKNFMVFEKVMAPLEINYVRANEKKYFNTANRFKIQ